MQYKFCIIDWFATINQHGGQKKKKRYAGSWTIFLKILVFHSKESLCCMFKILRHLLSTLARDFTVRSKITGKAIRRLDRVLAFW